MAMKTRRSSYAASRYKVKTKPVHDSFVYHTRVETWVMLQNPPLVRYAMKIVVPNVVHDRIFCERYSKTA